MTQTQWIKCSDQMPPKEDVEILIRRIGCTGMLLTPADEIWYDINPKEINEWEWLLYTEENWRYLKNGSI